MGLTVFSSQEFPDQPNHADLCVPCRDLEMTGEPRCSVTLKGRTVFLTFVHRTLSCLCNALCVDTPTFTGAYLCMYVSISILF